ncbi:putative cytochrome P450 [Xylaria bambusicola]|uniref:putative cytochrome P450 n=1 Tax=Xylaria bambusicola TaxID=326684 RepID=UPI002008BEFC|nr:putative cytochrome P450 [Xylaria bambusicola]KAI0516781.1 putative cytochrome P450 [Xylaria bambusicola]
MSLNYTSQITGDSLGASISIVSTPYAISFITVILGLAWVSWTQWWRKPKLIPGIHVVGGDSRREIMASRERFRVASRQMVLSGYEETGGKDFYYVPSRAGERLVMPTHFIEELKSAAIQAVDFTGIMIDLMEGRYTGLVDRSRLTPDTLKLGVSPKLGSMLPDIQEEIEAAFHDLFPSCDDWTEIEILPLFATIVGRATSRMMGGKTLSRDSEWINTAVNFTHCSVNGAQKIKSLPSLIRPILAPWIKEIRKDVNGAYRTSELYAKKIIEQRLKDGEWPDDLITLLYDRAKPKEKEYKFMAKMLLQTAFASIHTSTAAMLHFIMDLCEHPEYIDILRDEYRELMDDKGYIVPGGMLRLSKLDSCMKESQRHWPGTILTFERIMHKDRTLSNGMTVPAGHRIAVCNAGVNMDPNIFPEPEKFDGLRFHRQRQQDPSVAGKTQFVSCNQTSLNFGYGRHACPGRFFLADEYKIIIVRLLENYEFKYPEGKGRPPTLEWETQYVVNPAAKVMFRKLKTA